MLKNMMNLILLNALKAVVDHSILIVSPNTRESARKYFNRRENNLIHRLKE
jgi:hypothetical protein